MVQKLTGDKVAFALTGTFGTGKSTVAKLFSDLGARVIDADQLAHEAWRKTSPVFPRLEKLFKGKVRPDAQGFDRKKIAEFVFRDSRLRKQLEEIVHPYVFERIAEEVGTARAKVVIVEVPLLFETGFNPYFAGTITVHAAKDVILSRLKEKGFSAGEIEKRMEAQLSSEEKKARSDIIIDNSGTLQKTKQEVEKVWKTLPTVSKGAA